MTDFNHSQVFVVVSDPTNDLQTEYDLYKLICRKLGIVANPIYQKSMNKELCSLNYQSLNNTESMAITVPMQVTLVPWNTTI